MSEAKAIETTYGKLKKVTGFWGFERTECSDDSDEVAFCSSMDGFTILGERSDAYSQKDTSKWFHFFPVRDILLRFISLNLFFSAPSGLIYPIFVWALRRVHDLSYSKLLAAEKIFLWGSEKNFNFQIFLEGKGYIFASRLYSKLGSANIFALIDETPFCWLACCDVFYKLFFRSVFVEKAEFFETDSTFRIAHCVSWFWRSFSTNTFAGSVCLLLSCIGNVVIDRERISWWTEVFRWRKQLRTQVFSEGKCYFVTLLWPNIPCVAFQSWLG